LLSASITSRRLQRSAPEPAASAIPGGGAKIPVAANREFLDADGGIEGDCLIPDVHLPGMSGIELFETMRRRGDMLPVIVISDRIAAATRHRVRAVGALAVVEKPYQVEEVLDLLCLAMDQR
jgi:FixJ family two-component response regulator